MLLAWVGRSTSVAEKCREREGVMSVHTVIDSQSAPLVVSTRAGVAETIQRGHIALVDHMGTILWSVGDPHTVTFMRSSAKPLQAIAALQTGIVERYGLTPTEIAILCASHGAEPMHLEAVRSIWQKADLHEDLLGCGAHPPMHAASAIALYRAGGTPTPIHNNCSGKHSGMLAAAHLMGEPLDSYLDSTHPHQQRILSVVARFSGSDAAAIRIGVDGCSAPNVVLSLAQMARAFASLAVPTPAAGLTTADIDAARQVSAAMRAVPQMVGGTRRFDTDLMTHAPEALLLIAKGGAEGVECVGWRDPVTGEGRGLALKLESGRDSYGVAVLSALAAQSIFDAASIPALSPYRHPVITNVRGLAVGDVRSLLVDEGSCS